MLEKLQAVNWKNYRTAYGEISLQELREHSETKDEEIESHPQKDQMAELENRINTLRSEIAEYDGLIDGEQKTYNNVNLAEIPSILIKARIMFGLTQEELAEKAGLKVEQLERIEKTGYMRAKVEQVFAVMEALGIKAIPRFEFSNLD